MSSFSATFLRDGRRLFSGKAKPQVWFCAFGKHPGWDDHMEPLGLETETLLALQQVLYIDGIGSQVNRGEWEKLSPENRLPALDHLFVWKRDAAFLIGRIWSSKDGKGRAKYPMIACAQFAGIALDSALAGVLPVLDEFRSGCINTTSADDVRAAHASAFAHLQREFEGTGPPPLPQASREADFVELINPPGAADAVLLRVLYGFQNQVPADTGDWSGRSGSIRLPATAGYETEAFLYWNRFLDSHVPGHPPVLTVAPISHPWLDVLIGEPRAGDFFFLQAEHGAVAVTSELEYDIGDDFRKAHAGDLDAMRANAAPQRKTWINKLLSQG